jgi:hypothetical protein
MTSITITHYTDPGCPFAWSAEPETEALLAEDLAQARRPTPAALALAHKLAPTGDTSSPR